jgi:hypothetical protein
MKCIVYGRIVWLKGKKNQKASQKSNQFCKKKLSPDFFQDFDLSNLQDRECKQNL